MSTEERLREQLVRFGHRQFRPGQERVIRAVVGGRDILAVLPTGSGKSLVYQLSSQMLPGVTLVVSPLIALMKDQVESMRELGIAVGVVNSSQTNGESESSLQEVEEGRAKLLYVAPERFDDDEFMERMKQVKVSLFCVDEAHCVSEWGHDFRPAYLELADAARELGRPTMLALTATATPWVRSDIIERLSMNDPDIVVRGVDRPNLFLEVIRVDSKGDDARVLHSLLLEEPKGYPEGAGDDLKRTMGGSGIVYTRTTRAAMETAELLREWGVAADFYHGQRKKSDRERVQEQFMSGDLRVIVATNAFGLGVDKPDVRFVIHLDIPASLDAYYQEAGRAGRDGEFARCALVYRPEDLGRAAFLSNSSRLKSKDFLAARKALQLRGAQTREELAEETGIGTGALGRLLEILANEGKIRERSGLIRMVADFDPDEVSLSSEERRKAYEASRLEMTRGYAESDGCRRRYILNYFGEEYESDGCSMCDNDISSGARQEIVVDAASETAPSRDYSVGDAVQHESWGDGVVQRVEEGAVTVLFESTGYRTLDAVLVEQNQLLRPKEPGAEGRV